MKFVNKISSIFNLSLDLTLIAKSLPEKLNNIRSILHNNNVDLSYMSVNKEELGKNTEETIKIELSYRNNINFSEIEEQLRREDVQINRQKPI